MALTGPDGLPKALTKTVIEIALGEEMAEHLAMTSTVNAILARLTTLPGVDAMRRSPAPLLALAMRATPFLLCPPVPGRALEVLTDAGAVTARVARSGTDR